ncbi:unnamed protein product [Boreogadus saida]
MGTCWLFCLAAPALSSGSEAEEKEEEEEEEEEEKEKEEEEEEWRRLLPSFDWLSHHLSHLPACQALLVLAPYCT